ncbi:MAG TPA: hypothetical protein VMH49_01950 [Thermoplasmata archaeon]|nr:hypothetical protein [Thermoplasmata archaeon]
MFSRREREFLHRLVRPGDPDGTVEAFPNPVYRRKLLWSIRRKTARAVADWELLAAALRNDPRLGRVPEGTDAVPLFREPFAALLRSLGRRGRTEGRSAGASDQAPEP